jgi:hypothetical protein
MAAAPAILTPPAEESPMERRQNTTTAEWLADLKRTFHAVVMALDGGLLPAQVLPEHKAERLGRLLDRGEWRAVVEAADRHVTRMTHRQSTPPMSHAARP